MRQSQSSTITPAPSPNEALDAASISARLAGHIASARYDSLPAEALDAAKFFMLDTLAVAWAGSDQPGCVEAWTERSEDGGVGEATAWSFGNRLPARAAAFVNGTIAAALDYDALGREAAAHVNVVVIPAALALAEKTGASGADFLAALVIGSDIHYRLALSSRYPNAGWNYTSVLGVFGAAAAAARILRLDAQQTQHALGIAYLRAAGTQLANVEPSLSKRMLSGFAAEAGVEAAKLAARGITASSHVFEGKFGLYHLYQEADAARLLAGLGERFVNTDLVIKKYPSCGCNHTAIDATLELVQRYDLKPEDVEAIHILVPPMVDRIVGMPYDPSTDPQVAAQFSITYSIACTLVRRRLGLAEIQLDAALDPAIMAHIPKVKVSVDPELTGERGPVTLTMHTRTHGVVSSYVEHVAGSLERPISASEVDAKLAECFAMGVRPLGEGAIADLKARVQSLETLPDMSRFFDGL